MEDRRFDHRFHVYTFTNSDERNPLNLAPVDGVRRDTAKHFYCGCDAAFRKRFWINATLSNQFIYISFFYFNTQPLNHV